MISCPVCTQRIAPVRFACASCRMEFEGKFHLPRLARLSHDQQSFIEALVLEGGNLKELSNRMGVSYPTLRKRLDGLIEAVRDLQRNDEQQVEDILKNIEGGRLSAAEGLRHIKEINGEL